MAKPKTRLRGYKKIFMLNSAEHEIFSANKYENANNMLNSAEHEIFPPNKSQITNNCKFFLAKHSWAWKFLY